VTMPVRTVTLRTIRAVDRLAAGVAELAEAYPLLAAGADASGDDPAETLARMLRSLGARVRVERDGDRTEAPARLDWVAADGLTVSAPLVGEHPRDAPGLFVEALGRLFTAGADLRFDALRGPEARFVGDLPTYPFQRERFWVDEPDPAASAGTSDAVAEQRPAPPAENRGALADYLLAELRDALQADELEPSRSFLDTGGDSFTFTLFITRIEGNYDMGLTPEDLPLDLPVAELIGRLADDIGGAGRGGAARTGVLERST